MICLAVSFFGNISQTVIANRSFSVPLTKLFKIWRIPNLNQPYWYQSIVEFNINIFYEAIFCFCFHSLCRFLRFAWNSESSFGVYTQENSCELIRFSETRCKRAMMSIVLFYLFASRETENRNSRFSKGFTSKWEAKRVAQVYNNKTNIQKAL